MIKTSKPSKDELMPENSKLGDYKGRPLVEMVKGSEGNLAIVTCPYCDDYHTYFWADSYDYADEREFKCSDDETKFYAKWRGLVL